MEPTESKSDTDQSTRSGFRIAVNKHDIKEALDFIRSGQNVNERFDFGQTALFDATINQDHDMIRALLSENADPYQEDDNGHTPLFAAVSSGDLDLLRTFYESGKIDLNKPIDNVHNSMMHIAAQEGHAEIVDFLIEEGALVEIKNRRKATPLGYSVFNNNIETTKALIKEGAIINLAQEGNHPCLHTALFNEDDDHIRLLLENNADPNGRDKEGYTPLHSILRRKKPSEKHMQWLIDYNADVNHNDNRCASTPMHFAIVERHVKCAQILLDHNAVSDIPNIQQRTVKDLLNIDFYQRPQGKKIADKINAAAKKQKKSRPQAKVFKTAPGN